MVVAQKRTGPGFPVTGPAHIAVANLVQNSQYPHAATLAYERRCNLPSRRGNMYGGMFEARR